jgi:hypothetical protein
MTASDINKQIEHILDMKLPLDQTLKLLSEFWATLNLDEKKTEFSEEVNQWFKDNHNELINILLRA